MEPESCRVCGETTPAGARFCPSCGVGLYDGLLGLPDGRSRPTEEDPGRGGGGWPWGAILPLGAAVLLIAGLAVLSGSESGRPGTDSSDVSGVDADSGPVGSVPTPTSAPPAPAETATTSTRQIPTTSFPSAAPPVDVSELPALDATHLAVRVRNQLQFLDLQTGIWTRVELRSDVVNSYPVTTGLVLELPSQGIAFAPVEGGDLEYLSDGGGGLLGTRGDLVLLWGPGAGGDVQIVDLDGSEVATIDLPGSPWPRGATSGGDIVVQANEWIVLVDPVTGDHTTVATGNVAGVVDDLILVNYCTEDLECAVDQVSATTGERSQVTDEAGFFVSSGPPIVFSPLEGAGMRFFEVVDDVLVETDNQLATGLDGATPAHDRSGVMIEIDHEAISFVDSSGDTIAAVPAPFEITGVALPVLTLVGSRGLGS